jgi:hypothetical protein
MVKHPLTLVQRRSATAPAGLRRRPRPTTRVLWLLLALLLLAVAPIHAQEPEKTESLVYGGQVFDGLAYLSTLYPPAVDTIYLLANCQNILSPRRTLVYFWSLTNAYKADWSSLNEVVSGDLEVTADGELVATIPQESYVIQFPQGPDGPQEVYTGAEAEARYRAFDAARKAYQEALWAHNDAMQQHYDDLRGAREAREGGQQVELPEEPPAPEPPKIYSTPVGQGSVVSLPAGRYTVRVRADGGAIVAGSEKKVVVFAPRRRGLGYQIVPQEKWTRPERTDDPANVVYAREGTVLYLQPYVEEEYNDLYYSRLKEPQSQSGRADWWTWVQVRPFEEAGNLILDFGTQAIEVLAKPYRVEQLPGSALGYKVVDYDPRAETRPPDFVAYQLFVDANHASYGLELQDTDGRTVFGSQRQVRRVNNINSWALYFLAGLPLTVGAFFFVSRRERLAASRKALPPGEISA